MKGVHNGYTMGNVAQCDGVSESLQKKRMKDHAEKFAGASVADSCERIIRGYPDAPAISHDGGNRAFYRPSLDTVHLPTLDSFAGTSEYYSTVFHELTHSTGHVSRLDRGLNERIAAFGSADYSKEELVAEMGAAFLCAEARVSTDDLLGNQATYIASWLKVLRKDSKLVIQAASAGQKAADYILGS